jgi:putative ABC transport system permease protein
VIGFLASALRNRPWRAGTLALGILAAAVAFVLLTGSAATSALRIQGTLKSNYRNAYDILVRPQGSTTALERQQGLVRPNYLSGIYGGITFKQYRQIEQIPGVQVAAPIANIGYLMFPGYVNLPLKPFLTGAKNQLLRIRWSWASNGGLSRYPASATYQYYNPSAPPEQEQIPICTGFQDSRPLSSGPFNPALSADLSCSWPHPKVPAFRPETFFTFYFPVLISAIDPVQEARLLHLNRAVVRGRYLEEDQGLRVVSPTRRPVVSVLASTRTFLGDRLVATIERLRSPAGANVPALLGAGACEVAVMPCPKAYPPPKGWPRNTTAYSFLNQLSGKSIATKTFSAETAYEAASRSFSNKATFHGHGIYSDAFWTTTPSSYRTLGKDHLEVKTTTNSQSIWRDPMTYANNLWFSTPPQNQDTQFRRLHESPGINGTYGPSGGAIQDPLMRVVGHFDPARLPGFSPLSKVPLETYYPPELLPASNRSRALLHGNPLLPTQNLGDYVQQPPLLLTSLDALKAFFTNPHAFTGIPQRQRRAPISVIRVRVAGVTGTDALSQLRIRTVAQQIHAKTGLQIDVTAGSSPHPLDITLPAGKFGRPKLLLEEGWSKKGATISYLNALDRKDLALFALVLIVCCFFLANGSLAAVRARRTEIGTLRTLGWPGRAIFTAILGELIVVAAAAGLAGTGIAALLAWRFALHVPLSRVFYVLPLAVALALVAGVGPAWEATRGEPLDAIRPPVAPGRRGHAGGLLRLALLNLRRLPLRTAIAAGGLALGVAALTVLIGIERAFHGTLVGTLLGNAVSIQVRRPDLVAAGITIGLAALAVADVLYLNVRERAPELAALRATGWRDGHVVRLILLEGFALGLLGSAVGLAIGLLIGTELLPVPVVPLLAGGGIAAAAGVIAALVAATLPTVQALRIQPSVVLASE